MKAKLKFLLLALLFAAPLAAAWLLFFVRPDWQPGGHTNYGSLVSPARPLPDLMLADASGLAAAFPTGKWTLVYLGRSSCDAPCVERLLLGRQVRTALNQNRDRVQRVYLAPDAAALASARTQLASDHPDLLYFSANGPAAARFFEADDPRALYLLDPQAHWLMSYSGVVEFKALLADIKKLLRFSQVG